MSSNRQFPELYRLVEPERECSYLPTERAKLDFRLFQGLPADDLEYLIERGWRRFSCHAFRPVCANCMKCVPIRVDVERFRATKSQRKTWRKNAHIEVSLHRASVDPDHVNLFNRWHEDMTDRRDWKEQQTTLGDYTQGFLYGDFPSACELQYRCEGKLVGVGLLDVMPHSISSAYFYHDPDWRSLGPGTFSLLCEIDLAERLGLKYVYLGFWIQECPSMAYKDRFRPFEVLTNRPGDDEEPVWVPGGGENGE